MNNAIVTSVTAREAVHVLILQRLADVREGTATVLKGGVNLRLFFGSPRYSEDMDLDGDLSASMAIRDAITAFIEDGSAVKSLRKLGIRGIDPGDGPNKDTDTTFRYKFRVLARGSIEYPTKVEVSFRDKVADEQIEVAMPSRQAIKEYLGTGNQLLVRHYTRNPAIRQKIVALAARSAVQARDVFDLHVLNPEQADSSGATIGYLSGTIESEILQQAHDRALGMSYEEFEGQVLEYLAEDMRERFLSRESWEELQLQVAAMIDRVMEDQRQAG